MTFAVADQRLGRIRRIVGEFDHCTRQWVKMRLMFEAHSSHSSEYRAARLPHRSAREILPQLHRQSPNTHRRRPRAVFPRYVDMCCRRIPGVHQTGCSRISIPNWSRAPPSLAPVIASFSTLKTGRLWPLKCSAGVPGHGSGRSPSRSIAKAATRVIHLTDREDPEEGVNRGAGTHFGDRRLTF